MIATIIQAEQYISQVGRDTIKLTVLDDYDQKRYIFIPIEAMTYVIELSLQTKVPLVNKRTHITLNLAKLVNKVISVREDYTKFKGGFTALSLNNRFIKFEN